MEKNYLRIIVSTLKVSTYLLILHASFMMNVMALDIRAQSVSVKSTEVTAEYNRASVQSVLSDIEKKTSYKFYYNDNDIPDKVELNLEYNTYLVSDILLKISEEAGLKFKQVNNTIAISKMEKKKQGERIMVIIEDVPIRGIVTDDKGEPLPGATVLIKNTNEGVVTDIEGKFSFEVPEDAILVISSIGFETQEIEVNGQTEFLIKMGEEVSALDEVVVIGYGLKEKANITGATSTVKAKELVKRPAYNTVSLLQGRVAGLNIIQNSGQPGDEGLNIKLRGIGSFGNTQPYVLIDGIEGNISSINPGDIESVTVLKDAASAAIYGSRASNGVILITTKSGTKGKPIVELASSFSIQNPTRLPDFIYNSVEYMEMWNAGAEHTGVGTRYSDETINAFRNAAPEDPRYPNFNWLDHMFKAGSLQNHQFSIKGGGENNTYFFNVGYQDQKGIIDTYGAKRYSTRINLETDVNEALSVGFRSGIVFRDERESASESIFEMMLYTYTMPPTMAPYLTDGSGRFTARDAQPDIWRNRNPRMVVENRGGTQRRRYDLNPQAYIDVHPIKGLSWKTTAAWRYDRTEYDHTYEDVDGYNFSTNQFWGEFEHLDVGARNNDSRSSTIYLNSVGSYDFNLNDNTHNFKVLVGYEQQEMRWDFIGVYSPEIPDVSISDIDAGNPESQLAFGRTSTWALQSTFGRLSYDFKGKYLFEGNLRYDGSSKLHPDNRWDLFPSVSVGWRVSDESFLQNVGLISDLKLRASYGELGNQGSLGDFPYHQLLNVTSYPINGEIQPGVVNNQLSNPDLVWERVETLNLGLDMVLLKGLLGLEVDVYRKNTIGGHARAQIPASVGKSAPFENFMNMENRGIEILLSHTNRIGEVKYNVNAIFDKYQNKLTKVRNNIWGNNFTGTSFVEGRPINEFHVLDWNGIYQNQEQVDNLPIHEPYRNQTQPGDLIFRDANGDGEITVGNGDGDRVFVGGFHPDFSYSFNLNAEWKGFDISMFWQGVAGKKTVARWIGFEPFMQGGPVLSKWRDAWDGEGSTNSMPALYNLSLFNYLPITGLMSDWYLQNTSYLRLRNLQIGYNLPKRLIQKAGVSAVRMYVSGDNLITISDFEFDPERGDGSWSTNTYPQLTSYTLGLNVTF